MLRFLAPVGRIWLRFAAILGDIQITILLSLIYWLLLPFWALPYRLFSDRLALRNPAGVGWIRRTPGADRLNAMRKQG